MHENHRQRMKQRFLKDKNLNSFAEHEILEMLLYYSIPRRDTNPIAHRLLEKFGSLSNIFSADTDALTTVDGIGENTAVMLKLVYQTSRKLWQDLPRKKALLKTTAQAASYIRPLLHGLPNEAVYVFCLSKSYELKHFEQISDGSPDSANINIRDVFGCAFRTNSSIVLLAHNHPANSCYPSAADIQTTKIIKAALETLGIQLADHLIFTDSEYYSMSKCAKYYYEEKEE